jgi:hypothetical protein
MTATAREGSSALKDPAEVGARRLLHIYPNPSGPGHVALPGDKAWCGFVKDTPPNPQRVEWRRVIGQRPICVVCVEMSSNHA